MATMHEVEVWVMLNDQGEYVAHEDADELAAEYAERVGEASEAGGIRRVRLTVKVPLPEPIELTGEAAAEPEPGALRVA
ncbi:unnamed protein product [Gemmataceae bacterium]|nr:unnamed protein product [Gemmataceae bacterium]VTT99059.1 unnamed protein product [Gemmataceae bacterium]